MIIREIEPAGSITRSGMKELDYCLNPYLGCSHRCLYCYAIDMTYEKEASENWGDVIFVRKNIDRRLASDIKGLKRGIVGISTITDPYQPVEAQYRLTGKCLEILLKNGFRVTVQTKSPLVRLDLPLLARYRKMSDLGVTITTLNKSKSLIFETRTPSPSARVSVLKEASSMGIPTWIYYGPIIRGFNDSPGDIHDIMNAASESSSRIIYDFFQEYRGAMNLIRKEKAPVPTGMEDNDGWMARVKKIIEEESSAFGIRSNSESEEWLAERRAMFRTLF